MPRTPAYVSPFESLIKNPADRRSVIAAGVTAMLAVPAAAAMAANTDGGAAAPEEDWPGFRAWVVAAIALDELYEHARLHWDEWTHEQQVAHEDKQDASQVCEEAHELSRQMARVVDNSPRRLAMLVTFAIWGADKGSTRGWSHNSFDYTAIGDDKCIAEATAGRLLRALGPFAAATLPDVPFGRRYAEGRANV